MIANNAKLRSLGIFEISRGTVNTSVCEPREILMKALLVGATHISLCHNPPSNDPSPSGGDLDATNRLEGACRLIGIELLDHIIVCRDQYASFKEKGLL
jgi:DNA repair protein RadC